MHRMVHASWPSEGISMTVILLRADDPTIQKMAAWLQPRPVYTYCRSLGSASEAVPQEDAGYGQEFVGIVT
jgi:hypothetical protein